jgi:hypothetical protein
MTTRLMSTRLRLNPNAKVFVPKQQPNRHSEWCQDCHQIRCFKCDLCKSTEVRNACFWKETQKAICQKCVIEETGVSQNAHWHAVHNKFASEPIWYDHQRSSHLTHICFKSNLWPNCLQYSNYDVLHVSTMREKARLPSVLQSVLEPFGIMEKGIHKLIADLSWDV